MVHTGIPYLLLPPPAEGIKTKLGPITCKGDKPSDPTICGVLKRYQREG